MRKKEIKQGYILMVLTVGHIWIKQVLGPIVLVGVSILAPVGFSKSWVRMKHGDSGYAEEDIIDQWRFFFCGGHFFVTLNFTRTLPLVS